VPAPQRTQLLSALAPLREPIRGEAAALELWSALLVEALGTSLLRPIVATALALHGRDPSSLARDLPVLICLLGCLLGFARAVDLRGRCLRDAAELVDRQARVTLSW
jgi:hypothetical protein